MRAKCLYDKGYGNSYGFGARMRRGVGIALPSSSTAQTEPIVHPRPRIKSGSTQSTPSPV